MVIRVNIPPILLRKFDTVKKEPEVVGVEDSQPLQKEKKGRHQHDGYRGNKADYYC